MFKTIHPTGKSLVINVVVGEKQRGYSLHFIIYIYRLIVYCFLSQAQIFHAYS
jgi:hypothetical protein